MNYVRAFAPATSANVAVGFDLLGFSMGVIGDIVGLQKTKSREIKIVSLSSLPSLETSSKWVGPTMGISLEPAKNTATAGLLQLQQDLNLPFGFEVSIEKGIPLGSGLGGSAASAVAAIVAANKLLEKPLSKEQILSYALLGEAQASGSFHADNLAPCLYGGLTLARVRDSSSLPTVEVLSLPTPSDLYAVLVHPEISIETKTARALLRKDLSLKAHIEQLANLAGFIAACFSNDLSLMGKSLYDILIEPQRAHLIPGFYDIQKAAVEAGALGCSISGAGPSVFAWVQGATQAERARLTMSKVLQTMQVEFSSWVVKMPQSGARLLP